VDSYVAAMFVPQLLSGIFGVILTPFLPIYIEQRDARHGRHVAATTFLALLVASFAASIGVFMFSQLIVRVLVGNFSAEQQALTAGLLRILSLCTMFGSASAFLTILFNGHQDFVVPALSAFSFNIVVVSAVMLMGGLSIQGLAWATTVGIFAPGVVNFSSPDPVNFSVTENINNYLHILFQF